MNVNTYAWLNPALHGGEAGRWGIRGKDLKPGEQVSLVRKDGIINLHFVGQIIAANNEGVSLAEIDAQADEEYFEYVKEWAYM